MTETAREIFEQVFGLLRPRTPLPEFEVKFRPYADAYNVIRLREGRLLVGLSDLLEGAPRSVLEAIAFILIAKLYRKPIPRRYQARYRQFLNRRSVRHRVHAIRQSRGRKWVGTAQGSHFNLEAMFEDLNRKYFEGQLERPRLSWSRTTARTALGHFDPVHKAIIISKIFDRSEMPQFLLEYILYHEMLHLKYPIIHRQARRCFHSPQFREEERRYPHFLQAKRLLEKL
ncbi:MAG: M48 family metallopeptidase [Acidobacteria bacterium]|nr:M48 family metallopeptidase [Acidobacteriota bacterium]